MKLEIPDFKEKKQLFDFLIENKETLMAQKKYNVKHADALRCIYLPGGPTATKAQQDDEDSININLVINTTNWYDSHGDVHIDGLWSKSLKENKSLYLLEEHKMSFKGIITDEVKAHTEKMSWGDLGLKVEGETQALIFSAKISKDRNPYMFEQYQKRRVKNHSVGMRYVKLFLALNDPNTQEFDIWEKYFDKIANKEAAEANGYFWAVKEGKAIEGSAVPIGSNVMTPALYEDKSEPPTSTQKTAGAAKCTLENVINNFSL